MMLSAHVCSAGPLVSGESVDPTKIPGLVAWYDARYLNLADGALVGSWPDLSGNGFTAAQSSSSMKPTYRANHNGIPSVEFDNVDDQLQAVIPTQIRTLLCRFATLTDPTVSGNVATPVAMRAGTANKFFLISHNVVASPIRTVYYSSTDVWQGAIGGSPQGADTYFLQAVRARSSALDIFLNGALLSSAAIVDYKTTDKLVIGIGNVSGNNMFIASVMLYDRDLTSAEMEYLNNV